MRESVIYQDILEEGEEKGLQKGRQEGKEEKTKLKDELHHIKNILSQKDQEINRLKLKLNVFLLI